MTNAVKDVGREKNLFMALLSRWIGIDVIDIIMQLLQKITNRTILRYNSIIPKYFPKRNDSHCTKSSARIHMLAMHYPQWPSYQISFGVCLLLNDWIKWVMCV